MQAKEIVELGIVTSTDIMGRRVSAFMVALVSSAPPGPPAPRPRVRAPRSRLHPCLPACATWPEGGSGGRGEGAHSGPARGAAEPATGGV